MEITGPMLPFSQHLHTVKYRISPDELFRESNNRVAGALQDNDAHYHQTREITGNMRFMFAGRIQAAQGAPRSVTSHNCFLSGTILDSMIDGEGSIAQRATEAAQTMRMGGGIGFDFSTLRPAGELISSVGSNTDGPMAFMPVFDAWCKATSSAGNRRGAMMAVMRIDHPDIEAFIRVKQNNHALRGFNTSIAVTDEFFECLAAKKPFQLRWGGRVFKTVDPVALWEMVMRATRDWAEPGVLFIDTINRRNPLNYVETIAATNPCVPGDTLILTDKGHQMIETCVGVEVNVWNGKEFSAVTPFPTGVNPLVEVKIKNGRTLKCTPTHTFYVRDENLNFVQTEAQNLVPGDRLEGSLFPIIEDGVNYESLFKMNGYSQGFFASDGSAGATSSPVFMTEQPGAERLVGKISLGEHDGAVRTNQRGLWKHGPMPAAPNFVPIDGCLDYCIDWLSGFIDARGINPDQNGVSKGEYRPTLRITHEDPSILSDIMLMLQRLGCRANGLILRDGTQAHYATRKMDFWEIQLNKATIYRLQCLGLSSSKFNLGSAMVKGPMPVVAQLIIESVTELDQYEETFCFTEPKRGRGVFNGVLTGQCGEQPLPPFGACLLGSFNVVKYIKTDASGERYFDWDQFQADIPPIVRAMDNVIDRSLYPLEAQRVEAVTKRRMGLGITALANAGEALGFSYGSQDFVDFELDLISTLVEHAYLASCDLAQEKGSFELFDADKYLETEYALTLPEIVRHAIRKKGLRNSHLTSMAPTGTISFCADYVSASIEPVYGFENEQADGTITLSYEGERKVIMPSGTQTVKVSDYGFRELGVRGKFAQQVTAQEHIDVLIAAANLVDSAVSKTINASPNMPWEEFKGVYSQVWERGGKGCTTYTPNGMRESIMVSKSSKPAIAPDMEITDYSEGAACIIGPDGKKDCS